mmetsp:Transcript_21823/g.53747  ORF Transcript_21823/g.53747 Transcript_21823/m.53747 type:complete len:216 (+) Transcript_21823:202-849(+)
MQINVTRHPYSFLGDADTEKGDYTFLRPSGTWHTGLIDYADGTEEGACRFERQLQTLADKADIKFDYHVKTHWQPINSQRVLLWAGRFGKQEEFMSALNKRHFELRESASDDSNILAAVQEVGLDTKAAEDFLRTDELKDVVWRSYGTTPREKGIHAIPYMVFSVPELGIDGGPFRDDKGARQPGVVAQGSHDPDFFLRIFEAFRERAAQRARAE